MLKVITLIDQFNAVLKQAECKRTGSAKKILYTSLVISTQ